MSSQDDRPKRRDPREERRLRMERQVAAAMPPEPGGATDKPLRRDPRAERGRRVERPAAGVTPEKAAPPPPEVEPTIWILVVPDAADGALSSLDRDAIAAARLLADDLDAGVVAAVPPDSDDLASSGADRVVTMPVDGGMFAPMRRLAFLRTLIEALSPRRIVFPDSLEGGGDLGRRLAVAQGLSIATGLVRLTAGQRLRRARGGSRDQNLGEAEILMMLPEAADPRSGLRHEARPLAVDAGPPPEEPVRDLGLAPVDPESVPLSEADFIVSAGVGVTDWQAFHTVTAALGAATGGTRAVCDAGHLPRSRQVGASGTLVEPRIYLAFGISGAPQHLQGIARCDHVVAVNTDLHAAMIKRADLAIIADAQLVMPALSALVEPAS